MTQKLLRKTWWSYIYEGTKLSEIHGIYNKVLASVRQNTIWANTVKRIFRYRGSTRETRTAEIV